MKSYSWELMLPANRLAKWMEKHLTCSYTFNSNLLGSNQPAKAWGGGIYDHLLIPNLLLKA